MAGQHSGKTRAVVVGGSMVGMATARALSERFDEVTVVERDVLPGPEVVHRRGVQQSWHIHNLTLRGQRELEELFPGFGDEALRLGAVPIDHGLDVARCTDNGFCPLVPTGFVALSATRALMETAERNRFRALATDVKMVEGTRALSLVTEADGSRRRVRALRTDAGELQADLVVDCSGRAALWKDWFGTLGAPLPRESIVDSGCGYSSRFYRPRDGHREVWKAMTVDPLFPSRPRWGVIVPLEDDQWVVTLGGFNGNYPPSDEEGFVAFGRNLQTPLFSAWLDAAVPTTPIRTFRRLEMRWNHFERYAHPVTGFLAIGDSAFAYNPLYGQGMSIGVACARILRDQLRARPELDGLEKRYYPEAYRFARAPWDGTALLDLLWPKTTGKKPWYATAVGRVGHVVLRAAQYDKRVLVELLQGIHLLKSTGQMVTPGLVAGVLRFVWRRALARLPQGDMTRIPLGYEA
jgi:2-polyprenyl-6-methoxyphenol hydroxylase-like FAD-dependent oxidoreductase